MIYAYWNKKTKRIIYLGVDMFGKRHQTHLNQSYKNKQKINKFLQETQEGVDWEYIELININSDLTKELRKEIAHDIERFLIWKHKPKYNVKSKGEK